MLMTALKTMPKKNAGFQRIRPPVSRFSRSVVGGATNPTDADAADAMAYNDADTPLRLRAGDVASLAGLHPFKVWCGGMWCDVV